MVGVLSTGVIGALTAQTACVLDAVKYSCGVQNVDVIGAGGIGVALGGALARAGWNVTMVDINEAKLEAGRRYGIEVNGVKESNLRFMSFAEWTSADRAILLLCTKTYDNPVVLARIPLRHLLVPIQNGFDPVLNELNHPFEGIASFVSQCEANRPSTRITRIGELYLGGRRRLATHERNVLENLAAGFRRGGWNQVTTVALIGAYKSTKLMYNAAISPLAAAAGIDNEELCLAIRWRSGFFLLCSGRIMRFCVAAARGWRESVHSIRRWWIGFSACQVWPEYSHIYFAPGCVALTAPWPRIWVPGEQKSPRTMAI